MCEESVKASVSKIDRLINALDNLRLSIDRMKPSVKDTSGLEAKLDKIIGLLS